MKIGKYILLLIISNILATVVCIGLFHTFLLSNINVLMYRGLGLILITGIILFLLLILLFKDAKDAKDALTITIVFISINTVFFTLIPVTVERSVSVFTLSKMNDKSDKTFTKDEASKFFVDKYVYENDAFGKRFDEQIVTGSIKDNNDGSYTLTKRGEWLVNMFKLIGKLYNADMKNME